MINNSPPNYLHRADGDGAGHIIQNTNVFSNENKDHDARMPFTNEPVGLEITNNEASKDVGNSMKLPRLGIDESSFDCHDVLNTKIGVEEFTQSSNSTIGADGDSNGKIGADNDPDIGVESTPERINDIRSNRVNIRFKDHFTLPIPTTTISYRGESASACIINTANNQLRLEETYIEDDNVINISIRRASNATTGLRFLRLLYVTIAVFFAGCLFVLSLQYLLFVSLDLLMQLGFTSIQADSPFKAALIFLAFPGLIYGFSTALVIAGTFVMDTWEGRNILLNLAFHKVNQLTVEWVYFVFYLLIPCLLASVCLFLRHENWWSITTQYWSLVAGIFYSSFAARILLYELHTCKTVMAKCLGSQHLSWVDFIVRCIIYRQTRSYSGNKYVSYLAAGTIDKPGKRKHLNQINGTLRERTSSLSQFIMLSARSGCGSFFYELCYERISNINDKIHTPVYITEYTWSLETLFNHSENSNYIAIIQGPGAITPGQMTSSIICSMVVYVAGLVFAIAVVYFVNIGSIPVIVVALFGLTFVAFKCSANIRLYKTLRPLLERRSGAKKLQANEDDIESNDLRETEGLYFVNDSFRICKATRNMCLLLFCIEIIIAYISPLVGLLSKSDYTLGIIFLLVTGIAGLRYYINVAIVLEETGQMDLFDDENDSDQWTKKSQLNQIIGTITRGRSFSTFMAILGALWLCLTMLMIGALGQEVNATLKYDPFTFVYDFEYVQQSEIRYSNCQLTDNLGTNAINTMADFTFLTGNAYRTEDETQSELDGWFNGTAINNPDIVAKWRHENNIQSPLQFNLITFPGKENFAIIAIRGTAKAWDVFADAQLWSGAVFMQCLRVLLPAGRMWTPILDNLIWFMSLLEGKSLESVSFYKIITSFVQYIQSQPDKYSGVAITGHSLGGGLAIISGAQTSVLGVAVSGPNAMLSRKSFHPTVSVDALNKYTFNIIPDRDIFAHIDDPAENFQTIHCTDKNMLNCHSAIRSLCEIQYTCGSRGRPILCVCHTQYGYPEPTPIIGTNRTFAEACGY